MVTGSHKKGEIVIHLIVSLIDGPFTLDSSAGNFPLTLHCSTIPARKLNMDCVLIVFIGWIDVVDFTAVIDCYFRGNQFVAISHMMWLLVVSLSSRGSHSIEIEFSTGSFNRFQRFRVSILGF